MEWCSFTLEIDLEMCLGIYHLLTIGGSAVPCLALWSITGIILATHNTMPSPRKLCYIRSGQTTTICHQISPGLLATMIRAFGGWLRSVQPRINFLILRQTSRNGLL